jgi:predicted ATPase
MKIKKIILQNYKKFVERTEFSFTNPDGEINEQTLIVGNNGTGKSSILQAIVVLVASAIRETFKPVQLDWPGYEFRHLQTGSLPLKIEAEISFSREEIDTTKQFVQKLQSMGVKLDTPAEYDTVNLFLDFHQGKVIAKRGSRAFFQFSGYQYAKRLATLTPNKSVLFEKVGNIYWYNEQRNSHNISNWLDGRTTQLDDIKNLLSSAYSYHLAVQSGQREIREGEFDFHAKLESMYSRVFPGRSFVGSAPRFDLYEESKAPDFFLSDGRNQYELSGMSAGERAIFPILMDFARWNINNSIIIIDELELHLHPPLQQTLVRVLPKLGHDNQFIFTSHSDSVVVMFDRNENQIIRLPNE